MLWFDEAPKREALTLFAQYAQSQKGFQFPAATIDIEETPERDRLEVNMEVVYKGITYHFNSINKDPGQQHLELIYQHLDSQPLVRQKYADGKTRSREQSRVPNLSERFDKFDHAGNPKLPNPFSGFVVTDEENKNFLGMCVLGGGSEPHTSEMAFLNRIESWSVHPLAEIVEEFELKPATKSYQGVATTEVCTLLQYAHELKQKGYLVSRWRLIASHELKNTLLKRVFYIFFHQQHCILENIKNFLFSKPLKLAIF